MKNQIKLYRVVLNMIFYIFYVLLTSIAFTFIFPTIQTLLGYNVWLVGDPRFINIQFGIIILVFVFSLVFRKYFFLPMNVEKNISKSESKNETKKINKDNSYTTRVKEEGELDIKIGKEIK